MAHRHCGELHIEVVPRGNFYRVTVGAPGARSWTNELRPPASGFGAGVAYDSPAALDRVASDALDYVASSRPDLGERAERTPDGRGWIVTRKPVATMANGGDGGEPDDGVTIERVANKADLFHVYPGQHAPQPCHVSLDARSGLATADWDGEIGNAQPMAVFNGHVRRWRIPMLTAKSANDLLDELRPLFVLVVAGYAAGGDDDRRATFDGDAQQAIERIGDVCESWGGDVLDAWTDPSDYYGSLGDRGAQRETLGITSDTTEDELGAIVEREEAAAAAEGHVVPRIAEYLAKLHAEVAGGGSRENGTSRSEWHMGVKPGADLYGRVQVRGTRVVVMVAGRGTAPVVYRFSPGATARNLVTHRRAVANVMRKQGKRWQSMEHVAWGASGVNWPELPDPPPPTQPIYAPPGRGRAPKPTAEPTAETRGNYSQVEARRYFMQNILPQVPRRDLPAASEAWSAFIDSLHRDRTITDKQVQNWTYDEAAVRKAIGLGTAHKSRPQPSARRSYSEADARRDFTENVVPNLRHRDMGAAREAWSSHIDNLNRNGTITDAQAQRFTFSERDVRKALDAAKRSGTGGNGAPAAGTRDNATQQEARARFMREILPHIRHRDMGGARLAWGEYIDRLNRDGAITDKQFQSWTLDEAAVTKALGLGTVHKSRPQPSSRRSYSEADARRDFTENVVPHLRHRDMGAAREAWSSHIDNLNRNGTITDAQAQRFTFSERDVRKALDAAKTRDSMENPGKKAAPKPPQAEATVVSYTLVKKGMYRSYEALVNVRDGDARPKVYKLGVNVYGGIDELPGEFSEAARHATIAAVNAKHAKRR